MSKNAMWLTIIFAAAIAGAFLGPSLGSLIGETTMLILAPLFLIGVIVFCIWAQFAAAMLLFGGGLFRLLLGGLAAAIDRDLVRRKFALREDVEHLTPDIAGRPHYRNLVSQAAILVSWAPGRCERLQLSRACGAAGSSSAT